MVPHDASHFQEELDDSELGMLNLDEFGFSYSKRQEQANDNPTEDDGSIKSDEGQGRRPGRRRLMDSEIKVEVDTGAVSDSCFSFKKLWKYTGPGI